MDKDIQKIIADLDDARLSELETSVRQAREAKRTGVDIDSIRPGMTAEQTAKIRTEIARILACG